MNDTDNDKAVIFRQRLEWLGPNSANESRKSDKFYEIEVRRVGSQYLETRTWGRYGTRGQTQTLEHWSEYVAVSSAKEQIKKKRDKGYTSPVAPLTRLASIDLED